MKWMFSNDAPIYAQIVEQIKSAIVVGEFPPGDKMPSVRDMAAEAGVNPNTMQRAFAELERDGLVFSQRTAGRFVTEDEAQIETAKTDLAQKHILLFLSSMRQLGCGNEQIKALLERELEREKGEHGRIEL